MNRKHICVFSKTPRVSRETGDGLQFIDEPMNGLDKDGVSDMRKYLLSLKDQGKTILIASHSAEDIDVLCDTVCEMDKGVMNNIKTGC